MPHTYYVQYRNIGTLPLRESEGAKRISAERWRGKQCQHLNPVRASLLSPQG